MDFDGFGFCGAMVVGLWIPMVLGVVAVMSCDFESPFSALNSSTFQPIIQCCFLQP